MKIIFTSLLLHTYTVLGKPYIPQETKSTNDIIHNIEPTPAPKIELVRRKLENAVVAKRDLTSGQLIGSIAPDNTCGYNSGIGGMYPCIICS
jgi:hypothetical protein